MALVLDKARRAVGLIILVIEARRAVGPTTSVFPCIPVYSRYSLYTGIIGIPGIPGIPVFPSIPCIPVYPRVSRVFRGIPVYSRVFPGIPVYGAPREATEPRGPFRAAGTRGRRDERGRGGGWCGGVPPLVHPHTPHGGYGGVPWGYTTPPPPTPAPLIPPHTVSRRRGTGLWAQVASRGPGG